MAYQWTLYEKKGRIAHVTMNRPEVLNALHPPQNKEMEEIWDDFASDPEVWVAILSGAGDRAFCVGSDIEYLAAHPESRGASAASPREHREGGLVQKRIWKPIIAAVRGYCFAGGFEIALACDIIIAGDNAEFALPEVRTIGSFPVDGGPIRLPRQIPLKIAMELLLTGEPISAERAYQLGLVNRVAPAAEVITQAEEMAEKIVGSCPNSVRLVKEFVVKGLDMPVEYPYQYARTAWDLYYDLGSKMRASEDYRSGEGLRARAQKRSPKWTGR